MFFFENMSRMRGLTVGRVGGAHVPRRLLPIKARAAGALTLYLAMAAHNAAGAGD